MQILVSDTSVLVDLERGDLIEATCRLPHQFVVPDLLYRRELQAYEGPRWTASGLQIAELSEAEVQLAQAVRLEISQLSLPDSFAFALASQRRWTLLAGDGALRNYASARQVRVHGVLWVLDELNASQILGNSDLFAALLAISIHPRCRLPRAEIEQRLELWSRP
jgi:hypothetical protein